MALFHYIILRKDIPDGARLAMVAHAAGESAAGGPKLLGDTRAVVLAVANEAELRALAEALMGRFDHVLIFEDEGGFAGQAMAIGIRPGERDSLRQFVRHLPVFRVGK